MVLTCNLSDMHKIQLVSLTNIDTKETHLFFLSLRFTMLYIFSVLHPVTLQTHGSDVLLYFSLKEHKTVL